MDIVITIVLVLILVFVVLIFFCCCGKKRLPSVQVVNNSGVLFYKVKVGGVEFTEHLDECADGCSTGFIRVPEGSNTIQLQQTSGGPWLDLGDLGSFQRGLHYAVNIRAGGAFCAELWRRYQTTPIFNDDMTKELVASSCS